MDAMGVFLDSGGDNPLSKKLAASAQVTGLVSKYVSAVDIFFEGILGTTPWLKKTLHVTRGKNTIAWPARCGNRLDADPEFKDKLAFAVFSCFIHPFISLSSLFSLSLS